MFETAGPVVDSNMKLTLISSRDADPPVFTLIFNSSFGPPTVVECEVNGNSLNSSQYTVSRVVQYPQFVLNGELDSVNASMPDTLDVTEVTVTLRVRQSGQYRCVVTVMGRNDRNPQQVVTLGTGSSSTNISGKKIFLTKKLTALLHCHNYNFLSHIQLQILP